MLGSALVRDPKFQDRVVAENAVLCCRRFQNETGRLGPFGLVCEVGMSSGTRALTRRAFLGTHIVDGSQRVRRCTGG